MPGPIALRVAVAAACSLGLSPAALARPGDDPDPAPVVAALDAVAQWRDVPACAQELVACGPDHIGLLFDLLVEGEASPLAAAVSMDEMRAVALKSALRGQPEPALRAFLARLAAGDAADAHRVEGMRLLERFGSTDDLPLLALLAAGRGPLDAPVPRMRGEAFSRALDRILPVDPRGWRVLPEALWELPAALHAPLVEAVGRLRSDERLTVLAGMLGRSAALDSHVLIAVASGPEPARASVDPLGASRVRGYLGHRDPGLVALASQAVAHLGDHDAIGALVEAVGRTEAGLDSVAARALEELTGHRFGPDHLAWTSWLERELEWRGTRLDYAVAMLRDGPAERAVEVIAEMAGLRLHRDELADILSLGLERSESIVVAGTCRALANLNVRSPLPDLVRLLDDGRPKVRNAAHDALRRMTGERLPPEPELWAVRLGLHPAGD